MGAIKSESLGDFVGIRTTREVSLTRAGFDLLPPLTDAFAQLDQALTLLDRHRTPPDYPLAIGCLPSLATGFLPAIIERFSKRYPTTRVTIQDLSSSAITQLLADGQISLGITIMTAQRWDFEMTVLTDDPFCLLCRTDHALASKTSVSWTDLADLPLIGTSQATGNRFIIDAILNETSPALRWTHEAQHISTVIELVRQGVGIAIVPQLAIGAEQMTGLKLVDIYAPQATRQLGLLQRFWQQMMRAS